VANRLSQRPETESPRRRRPLIMFLLIGGLIVLIGAGGVGWWLFSPLFFHNTGNATNPFNGVSVVGHTPNTGNTPSTGGTSGITPTPSGPVILATGKFIDKQNSGQGLNNDHGSGDVTIGRTAQGKYIIYLSNLNVTNGPDLHVYLAPTSNSEDAGQVKSEGVDLGTLTATEGSVNVDVPTDLGVHLKNYHSVVIVCKTFSVIFTTAPLTFSS
jgi:hypothetical protein